MGEATTYGAPYFHVQRDVLMGIYGDTNSALGKHALFALHQTFGPVEWVGTPGAQDVEQTVHLMMKTKGTK